MKMADLRPEHFNWRAEGVRALRIYEGASDVRKIVIARSRLAETG